MIVCILQARLSSSRLPGKVLKLILERPVLELEIERVKRAKKINKIILATSTNAQDAPLIKIAEKMGVAFYQGSLEDVLDRYYQAAQNYQAEHVVRITGDCPLIDPEIIDNIISLHLKTGADYTSNVHPPTFPDGLDVEVFKFSVLKRMWENAQEKIEREHVTQYICRHPDAFYCENYAASRDWSGFRWTLDYLEDYELIRNIFENLYPANSMFGWESVVRYLQLHPEVCDLNSKFVRNEALVNQL